MSKLQLLGSSLLALGIAVVLFVGLVLYNKTNFHLCPPDNFCDYPVIPPEVYFGVLPVVAGLIMLGFHRPKHTKPVEV